MGLYLNPANISKEQWLVDNAKPISIHDALNFFSDPHTNAKHVLLLWVNNGLFTAVAYIHNDRELNAWLRDDSGRPTIFYKAPKEKLKLEHPEFFTAE